MKKKIQANMTDKNENFLKALKELLNEEETPEPEKVQKPDETNAI